MRDEPFIRWRSSNGYVQLDSTMEEPALLVDDIRDFFRSLRG